MNADGELSDADLFASLADALEDVLDDARESRAMGGPHVARFAQLATMVEQAWLLARHAADEAREG